MTPTVAVKYWHSGDISGELKRAAIFFEHIAFAHSHSAAMCKALVSSELARRTLACVETMQAKDVLEAAPEPETIKIRPEWLANVGEWIDPESLQPKHRLEDALLRLISQTPDFDPDALAQSMYQDLAAQHSGAALGKEHLEYLRAWLQSKAKLARSMDYESLLNHPRLLSGAQHANLLSRLAASEMERNGRPAVSLVDSFSGRSSLPDPGDAVLHLVLRKLPMPDENTPWEAIFDFRGDEDARAQLGRLRLWLSSIARRAVDAQEAADEFTTLLHDYSTYMRAQHRKFVPTAIESVVVASVEIYDSLPSVKIAPFVKAMFGLRKERASLLENELKAPGRELAFIFASQERFGRPPSRPLAWLRRSLTRTKAALFGR